MTRKKKAQTKMFAARPWYSHGNITRIEEESRQAGPSSLHAVRVRVQYLKPVCKDRSMGCSINSAVCVYATVHPCCFQTGLKRSIREGHKSSPTGTGQNQWQCAWVCCLHTLVWIAISSNLEIESESNEKRPGVISVL